MLKHARPCPLQPVEGGPHTAPGAHISEAQRIFEGHSNEKNFVGLAGELGGGEVLRLVGAAWLLSHKGKWACWVSDQAARNP